MRISVLFCFALAAIFGMLMCGCRKTGENRSVKELPNHRLSSTQIAATSSVNGSSGVTLRFLTWGEYHKDKDGNYADVAAFGEFAQKRGMNVELKFVEPAMVELEDPFNCLRKELGDLSMCVCFDYQANNAAITNITLPIDTSMLENYAKLDGHFSENGRWGQMDYVKGRRYGIPIRWDVQGLIYNESQFKESPVSFDVLWDPQYAGNYKVYGYQFYMNVQPALLVEGYPESTCSDMDSAKVDWDLIRRRLRQLAENTKGSLPVWPEIQDIEGLAMFLGNGSQMFRCGGPWRVAKLDVGNIVWTDSIVMHRDLKDSPEKLKAAYMFIDYMLSDDRQVAIYDKQGYVPTSIAAKQLLRKRNLLDSRLEDKFLDHAFVDNIKHSRTVNFYHSLWTDAMSVTKTVRPGGPGGK